MFAGRQRRLAVVRKTRPGRDVYSRARFSCCQRVCSGAGGRRLSRRALSIILTATCLGFPAACTRSSPPSGLALLHACGTSEGPTDASCGIFEVYENRVARAGRRLRLNIVALPTLAPEPKPDPLFFLAGGPGQGAAQMAAHSDTGLVIRAAYRSRGHQKFAQ